MLPREICDALCRKVLLAGGDLRRSSLMHLGLKVGGGTRQSVCEGCIKIEELAYQLMSEKNNKITRAFKKSSQVRKRYCYR